MAERMVRVFVSGSADLEPEREVIGEALARFPAPLPWEIRRTPHAGEQTPERLREVSGSDFLLLLLGQDVTAPVGAELWAARQAGVLVYALTKAGPHTPAGRFFQFNSVEEWEVFRDPPGLRRLVTRYLSQALLDDAARYGLTADEVAALVGYLSRIGKPGAAEEGESVAEGRETGGAQEGAIIVSGRDRGTRR